MGRWGYKTGGGQVMFYPYEKGRGDWKSFSNAEGGGGRQKTFWGIFYAEA